MQRRVLRRETRRPADGSTFEARSDGRRLARDADMKKSTERRMNLVIGTILLIQVGGVAFILIYNTVHKHRYHRDLLATHDLRLEYAGPGGVELQDPHAYLRKDRVVVSGCLNRTGSGLGPVASEIDVSLVSASASVLEHRVIRDLSQCKRGGAHFSMELAAVPSEGSVLEITAFAREGGDPMPDSPSTDSGG